METRWMERLEGLLARLAVRAHARPGATLLGVALVAGLGLLGASRLSVTADLEQLLPQTFQSVRDLEPVRKHFGGIGFVVVVGQGGDKDSLRRFADDFVPQIEKMPGIRFVDYKREFKFLQERSLYYLSLEDIQEIERRIKEREKYEKRMRNPMMLTLNDEAPPSLDFSDIEAKYGKRSDQRLAGGGQEYYLDPERKIVALLAKPDRISSDLEYSRKLIADVEGFFAKQDLTRYGKDFKVGISGAFKYKAEQHRQLSGDMATASSLAAIVLLLYLVFHFRSFLSVGFVLAPVGVGLAVTYGLTYTIFGSLNVLTGFLGAILGGLGIEHGIHLLGRYDVLRGQGHSSEEAVKESFRHTGGSALVSSLVASLTFLSVAVSEFRAFREFGVIAAIGMVVVFFAYVPTLSSLLGLASRLGWAPHSNATVAGTGSELSRLLPRFPVPVLVGIGVMLAAFSARIPDLRFDFDFHSLEDSTLPSFALDKEVNRILGYSQEPVVILTQKTESERELVRILKERQVAQGEKSTVDFVAALSDLIPTQQAEKKAVFDSIHTTLKRVKADKLDPDTRKRFDGLMRWVQAEPFTREDVPKSLRRQFESVTGDSSNGFVLIFPSIKLSDGLKVRDFAREVRGISLSDGAQFSAAGEAMVLADVLEMVTRESPPILLAATLLVLLAMWITLGSFKTAIICLSPTVLSLVGMFGLMAVIDQPFNYLNILIVPVLIGTTVDAGVHLISRLSEAHGDLPAVYAETGRAICGGLFTSAVGFGAMLLADHPGLNSLGRLANLGLAMNLIVMLVGFPPAIQLLARKKRKDGPEAAPVAEA